MIHLSSNKIAQNESKNVDTLVHSALWACDCHRVRVSCIMPFMVYHVFQGQRVEYILKRAIGMTRGVHPTESIVKICSMVIFFIFRIRV